jgi:hypothetical protein
MLSINDIQHNVFSVIMLSVVMLSVVMLSVVMLSVMEPLVSQKIEYHPQKSFITSEKKQFDNLCLIETLIGLS